MVDRGGAGTGGPRRTPHAPGLVLVVDGPSTVDGEGLVAGLQASWPDVRPGPLVSAGLAGTLRSLGRAGFDRWWDLIRREDRAADGTVEHVAWGPLGRELVGGMHRAAAAWAVAGFDVVVDHLLLDHATVTDLSEALEGLPSLHIGLIRDPGRPGEAADTAAEPPGRTFAELRASRDVAVRDLVLDTTGVASERTVARILDAVATRMGG